jgi:hypothetical protein
MDKDKTRKRKRGIMTPGHPRWREFTDLLRSPEGCDFREEGASEAVSGEKDKKIVWTCHGDHRLSRAILERIGNIDIESSIAFFVARGGGCDCEILFNVDMLPEESELSQKPLAAGAMLAEIEEAKASVQRILNEHFHASGGGARIEQEINALIEEKIREKHHAISHSKQVAGEQDTSRVVGEQALESYIDTVGERIAKVVSEVVASALEPGDEIELVSMPNDPDPIPAGTRGIIERVTQVGDWTSVDVKWLATGKTASLVVHEGVEGTTIVSKEGGRSLSLTMPPDRVRIIKKAGNKEE